MLLFAVIQTMHREDEFQQSPGSVRWTCLQANFFVAWRYCSIYDYSYSWNAWGSSATSPCCRDKVQVRVLPSSVMRPHHFLRWKVK